MISILFGNELVKAKREIFARIAKWRAVNCLRVYERLNFWHLLITLNFSYTKKPEKTSYIPLDGIAFQVGYTETSAYGDDPKVASIWYCTGRGAVKAPV